MSDVLPMSPQAKEIARLEKLAADQRAAMLHAIQALEDGRRCGDALRVLKAAVGHTSTTPSKPETGAVA
jgi:hypothetical protein